MLADLLFIFFNRKVTNLFSLEAAEKDCHACQKYNYVLAKEIAPYNTFKLNTSI